MTPAEKKAQLLAHYRSIPHSQDRYAEVVRLGREAPGLAAEFRTEAYRVEGCLSKLWFVPRYDPETGCCDFKVDSDSAIVKGMAVLLCGFYSGLTPAQILQADPAFLSEIGFTQHLTPNRRNGLARLGALIRAFAEAQRAPAARATSDGATISRP